MDCDGHHSCQCNSGMGTSITSISKNSTKVYKAPSFQQPLQDSAILATRDSMANLEWTVSGEIWSRGLGLPGIRPATVKWLFVWGVESLMTSFEWTCTKIR